MRLIIAGSRTLNRNVARHAIEYALANRNFTISEIVSGHAHGVDRVGESWARANGLPVKLFIPEWNRLGRGAGIARNIAMGKYADRLLAVWDGESKGTDQMIRWMLLYGKPAQVVNLKKSMESNLQFNQIPRSDLSGPSPGDGRPAAESKRTA